MTRQDTDTFIPPAKQERRSQRRARSWQKKHARLDRKSPPRKSRLGEAGTARGHHLAEFHPVRPWDTKFGWRPLDRDHRKLLVIDNRAAGMGGLNVGMEYGSGFLAPKARKCDLWRDNGIGIVGPGVQMFADCFART